MPSDIEFTTCFPGSGSEGGDERVTTMFVRSLRGRHFGGRLSQVFRPMMREFVVCREELLTW